MRTKTCMMMVMAVAQFCCAQGFAGEPVSLAGAWQVQLKTKGTLPAWNPGLSAMDVRLPGSIQAQGFGDEVSPQTKWIGGVADRSWWDASTYEKYRQPGNIKIPFWLQPERHFLGTVTYRRVVDIPAGWAGKRVELLVERVHITSRMWLDGREIGTENSLSTPHRYDLGHVAPGSHEFVIAVDNQMPAKVGNNAHCVSDHMQTAWNGMIGRMELRATPDVWIEGLETYPDVSGKQVRVKWRLGGKASHTGRITLAVFDPAGKAVSVEIPANAGEGIVKLGDAIATWDEFKPNLYRLEATLTLSDGATHVESTSFGMVDYRIEGKRFLVNGRPTIFRGTLDCAMFPMTGYPSTDVNYWKRVIGVVKAHGLNHVRFHSWCPPEAAFIAADELGCYLLVEHAWTAPEEAGEYIMREAERVIQAYGNHPSFAMHAYGNEPTKGTQWLEEFANHFRQRDPRRYYSGATGWPMLKNNQYHSLMDGLRVYPWGAGLGACINLETPNTMGDFGKKTRTDNKPFLSHETGQWCVYPDFDEIPRYTGFLKAKNFEIFRDFLVANHMEDQARDFLMASGRLQTLCYKYEIEKLLRTPDIGGYQLLGLNDFPGQGTALVGAVNPFWDTKSYTTPAEYHMFSGPSVPLARLPRFIYRKGETVVADLEISHYASAALKAATPLWSLVDKEGRPLASGRLVSRDIPVGLSGLGRIEASLADAVAPCRLKLVVEIEGQPIRNQWDLWVYPAKAAARDAGAIVITRDTAEAWAKAEAGGTVLLIPLKDAIIPPEGPKVVLGFSTIFWNTAWTRRQPPTTMGILCDPRHPVFAGFPTESHSNYQWWYLLKQSRGVLSLQGQDPAWRPLVQVIDDWFTARRLGLVVEAKCGQGRMLISAIDFEQAALDPVSSQFRDSLLAYMSSERFKPSHVLSKQDFRKMVQARDVVGSEKQ